MTTGEQLARQIMQAAGEKLAAASEPEIAQVFDDLRQCGVACYRINLEGQLERLDPMKVQIRQPWDRPRHE